MLTWTPRDSSIYLLELLEKFVDHLGGINTSNTNLPEQRTMLPSDIIDRATEVVKNLHNIFDKLFEILTSQEDDLKTRDQEQFAIPIDMNKIHQTAFHALVRKYSKSPSQHFLFIYLDSYIGFNLHETIRIISNCS